MTIIATPVADELAYLRTLFVNVAFIGSPGAGDRGWVLVDAGVRGTAAQIAAAAEQRFSPDARPSAIILTHGHFDHVGALRELAERWEVPVYAHPLEMPYITGRSAYPPPDPTVGGGAMASMSRLYPRGPYDFGDLVHPLPEDGSVPTLPDWKWIHTPGHTQGHVALFRESDRVLIAGDAFVTTKQESAFAVLTQSEELHGPPSYFTPDWVSAEVSVQALADLEPTVALTGHGRPMRGAWLTHGLRRLADDFRELAVPEQGRYVNTPAVMDEEGVVSLPPAPRDMLPAILAAVAVGAVAAMWLANRRDTSVIEAATEEAGVVISW